MKFKVGDVVRAIDNYHIWASEMECWTGLVIEVCDDNFKARTINSKHISQWGLIFDRLKYEHFELIESNPVKIVQKIIKKTINNNKEAFDNVDFKYEIKAKKPILDEIEKEYLSNVIKPFRNRVTNIIKFNNYDNEKYQYICIKIKNEWSGILLPNFIKGTMYKGMEVNKNYNLEELGL